MTEMQNERRRLLVKISRLYYEDGLNQQDIAKRLGISRPHVSRMLAAARAQVYPRDFISCFSRIKRKIR
jgi:deoxyribonucleoside regulator